MGNMKNDIVFPLVYSFVTLSLILLVATLTVETVFFSNEYGSKSFM
jgi:hypothetical protein